MEKVISCMALMKILYGAIDVLTPQHVGLNIKGGKEKLTKQEELEWIQECKNTGWTLCNGNMMAHKNDSRNGTMIRICQYGDIEKVKMLIEYDEMIIGGGDNHSVVFECMEKAAYEGHFEIVKLLYAYARRRMKWWYADNPHSYGILYNAVAGNHFNIVEWVAENDGINEWSVIDSIALLYERQKRGSPFNYKMKELLVTECEKNKSRYPQKVRINDWLRSHNFEITRRGQVWVDEGNIYFYFQFYNATYFKIIFNEEDEEFLEALLTNEENEHIPMKKTHQKLICVIMENGVKKIFEAFLCI